MRMRILRSPLLIISIDSDIPNHVKPRHSIVNILKGMCGLACFFVCLFVCFLGLHPWHMEIPRLGVQLELQLPAYTTATATQDPSRVCDLHHSSWQRQILNPLRQARDRTCNLMVPSRISFCCATTGTPGMCVFKKLQK